MGALRQLWYNIQNTTKIPLIIRMGESNSGGDVANVYATANELLVKPRVQQWDSINNNGFISMQCGVNELLGHRNLEGHVTTYHGWGLQIANRVNNDDFGIGKAIHVVNTGQGGSTVDNWIEGSLYIDVNPWQLFLTKVNSAISALGGLSKVQPYIMFSLGINDAVNYNDPVLFYTKMLTLINNVRAVLPNVSFYATRIPSTLIDYYNIDTQLVNISNAVTGFNLIDTSDLVISGNHWLYADQKKIVNRMTAGMFGISNLDTPSIKLISASTDISNNAIVHLVCDEDMEASPSSTGIVFSPPKTISSIVRNGTNLKQLDITISVAFAAGDFITMTYTPGTIKGVSTTPMQATMYYHINNSAYVNIVDAISTIDGSGIYLNFPVSMSIAVSTIQAAQFKVSGKTVTDVVTVGTASTKSIKLVLNSPLTSSDNPTVSYIANHDPILTATVGGGVNNFSNFPVSNMLNMIYSDLVFIPNTQLTNVSQVYGTTNNGDVAIGTMVLPIRDTVDYRIIMQRGSNNGGGIGYVTGQGSYAFNSWRQGIYIASDSNYVQKISFGTKSDTTTLKSTYLYVALARINGFMFVQGSNDLVNWVEINATGYNQWAGGGNYIFLNVHNTTDKVYYPQQIGF